MLEAAEESVSRNECSAGLKRPERGQVRWELRLNYLARNRPPRGVFWGEVRGATLMKVGSRENGG